VKDITPQEKAKLIAQFAAEKKGENIVLMDMTAISTMCDWFVLISAKSSRRMNAISNIVQDQLSKKKIKPVHVEGKNNPLWTVLDYENVVVHIFHKDIREYYGLERLWSAALSERYDNK